MKNRKLTGTLGAVVTLGLIALVCTGKATLTEVSGFAVIAAALIGSKDEHFIKNFTGKKDENADDKTK